MGVAFLVTASVEALEDLRHAHRNHAMGLRVLRVTVDEGRLAERFVDVLNGDAVRGRASMAPPPGPVCVSTSPRR